MIKAEQLAADIRARLVMPSQTLLDGMEYVPSVQHIIKTATVHYLNGHVGRVMPASTAHPSARRVYA